MDNNQEFHLFRVDFKFNDTGRETYAMFEAEHRGEAVAQLHKYLLTSLAKTADDVSVISISKSLPERW